MTTRYGQKAYGQGVYSGPDTYALTAIVNTDYESASGIDGDFVLGAVVSGEYAIDNFIQFIGPLNATVYTEFFVQPLLGRLVNIDATVESVFGVAASVERSVGLFSEVIVDVKLSNNIFIGSFWTKEYPSGTWISAPAPLPIDWTPEIITTVEWRN